MAGEVVAVGGRVKDWKAGDRVCANFMVDHLHGDFTEAIGLTALGAPIDGVLAEYKIFSAYVSLSSRMTLMNSTHM